MKGGNSCQLSVRRKSKVITKKRKPVKRGGIKTKKRNMKGGLETLRSTRSTARIPPAGKPTARIPPAGNPTAIRISSASSNSSASSSSMASSNSSASNSSKASSSSMASSRGSASSSSSGDSGYGSSPSSEQVSTATDRASGPDLYNCKDPGKKFECALEELLVKNGYQSFIDAIVETKEYIINTKLKDDISSKERKKAINILNKLNEKISIELLDFLKIIIKERANKIDSNTPLIEKTKRLLDDFLDIFNDEALKSIAEILHLVDLLHKSGTRVKNTVNDYLKVLLNLKKMPDKDTINKLIKDEPTTFKNAQQLSISEGSGPQKLAQKIMLIQLNLEKIIKNEPTEQKEVFTFEYYLKRFKELTLKTNETRRKLESIEDCHENIDKVLNEGEDINVRKCFDGPEPLITDMKLGWSDDGLCSKLKKKTKRINTFKTKKREKFKQVYKTNCEKQLIKRKISKNDIEHHRPIHTLPLFKGNSSSNA